MTLQGDLQSFALPDVLRLLAGTSKTGRLGVTGTDRSGDVWLKDGSIVAGEVSSSPHAKVASDVVFELLRFETGSFIFDDGEESAEAGDPSSVDDAIGQAEELVREWHEVESVVPSVQSWVTFAPEISGDSTTVSADHWRVLALVGGGLTVRELGDHFGQTDLVASRQVKDLLEAGLVELGEMPTDRAESASSRSDSGRAYTTEEDLSVMRADDGPVVLESSDDALLPEPLPSEGTSFEGDLTDMGPVDGRSSVGDEPPVEAAYQFESQQPADVEEFDADPSFAQSAASDEPFSGADFEGDDPVAEPPAEPSAESSDPFDGSDDFFGAARTGDGPGGGEEVNEDDPLASTPSNDAAADAAVEGVDTDRGALLDFLSTVKP